MNPQRRIQIHRRNRRRHIEWLHNYWWERYLSDYPKYFQLQLETEVDAMMKRVYGYRKIKEASQTSK